MPLYRVFTRKDALDQSTKASVAKSITDTHCRLAGSPKQRSDFSTFSLLNQRR